MQTVTPFLHDKDVGKYGLEPLQDGLKTGQKVSQHNQVVHGTALKLVIKGQSQVQAGQLITFNLGDVNSSNTDNQNDHRFSGNYIKKNVINSGVSKVMIERTANKCYVTIYTSRPGFVIGKKGSDIDKIKNNLSKFTTNEVTLNIKEVKKPETLSLIHI